MGMYGLAQAAPIKIGCVDMQRAIKESMAGKEMTKEGREIYKKSKERLNNLREKISRRYNEYIEQEMVLSARAKKEIEDELEQMFIMKDRLEKDSYREIRKFERKAVNKITAEIREIIKQVGKNEGFTLILDSTETEQGEMGGLLSKVLYTTPDADITDKVLKLYDKQYAASKGKK
jgi:outer membrane protein